MTGRRRIPWLRAGLFAAVVGWLTLMGLGFERLLAHGAEAGSEGAAVQHWPGSPELLRDPARASLVVFVHPRCPCTVATLRELARLAPRLGGSAKVTVLMRLPSVPEPGWQEGDIWRLANGIPDVTVQPDPGGVLTARFGPVTSGHVLVYTKAGRLGFSGGITPGRGHEGASAGQAAILEAVTRADRSLSARVFGCELFDK